MTIWIADENSEQGRMMQAFLSAEMQEYRRGYERNLRLPLPDNLSCRYETLVQYFSYSVKQHKRIERKLDQIAERVGGISSWFDRNYPLDGKGGWTEWRQATSWHDGTAFYEEAKTYAECCKIFDNAVRNHDGLYCVKSYDTEVYRRYFNKDERSVTTHKNLNA